MESIIDQAVRDLYGVDVTPNLTRPEPQFGDVATNVAMQLAKQVGENPRAIAERIAEVHDGSIRLHTNDPEQGTCFALSIPRVYAASRG